MVGSVLAQEGSSPNVLIVTVDDMSCDSIGVYGCGVSDTTPTMDEFAKTAMKFEKAHVLVGNCMPGRNLMWSGLYSHVNGVEGFRQNPDPDYPVLCDLAKDAGYFTGIRGKVNHSTPYVPYAWDAVLDQDASGKAYHKKDARSFGESTKRGIDMARQAGKPFCLVVNISDPHKPFYTQGYSEKKTDPHVPTKVFDADDVVVPGFLFDDPAVRDELAIYYSSVRRADDAFASILKALQESGQADDTFVMFLSDHGMPLPFAKTQLYHHSTRTPLMVRWPGVTEAADVDDDHFVSAIDFLPTLLDVMRAKHPTPERLHGRSFAPLLRGQTQRGRDHVVKQYNENSGRNRHPMRAIQNEKWLYIYNPWSNGERVFATATNGTATARRMREIAKSDSAMAKRVDVYDHRTVEELYLVSEDPDCRKNLIGSASAANERGLLRAMLAKELERIDDPVAPLLKDVEDDDLREAFMAVEDAKSEALKKAKPKKRAKRKAA